MYKMSSPNSKDGVQNSSKAVTNGSVALQNKHEPNFDGDEEEQRTSSKKAFSIVVSWFGIQKYFS